MRSVALIIVHFRNVADTLECLESARNLIFPPDVSARIIVVENGSGDDSWSQLVRWACDRKQFWHSRLEPDRLPQGISEGASFRFADDITELVLLKSEKNGGYAAGCNRGLQFALADLSTTHLWLLNNDIIFHPHALERLLDADRRQGPAVFGPTMLYQDDPHTIQVAGGARYWRAIGRSRHYGKRQPLGGTLGRPLDYIVGASMFFRREVVQSAGLLPEHFFLYFEETEWCARVRERGFDMAWVPDATIIHKEGKSTGNGRHFQHLSDLSFRYIVRNSLLFSRTRFPLWLPSVFLFNLYESLRYCIAGDRKKLSVFVNAVREFLNLDRALMR